MSILLLLRGIAIPIFYIGTGFGAGLLYKKISDTSMLNKNISDTSMLNKNISDTSMLNKNIEDNTSKQTLSLFRNFNNPVKNKNRKDIGELL